MEDENWLLCAKNGDMYAFEQLIVCHEKMVFNVCYRVLNNMEDAKDAAQEVFIKLYMNLDKCTDTKGFKSWLYTIANNTCIDYIRKQKNKKTNSLDALQDTEDGSYYHQIPSDEKTPEEVLLTHERSEHIQNAIMQLNEQQRILLVLRDIKGLSYEEMAKATNLPLGTVKSRLSRARIQMQGKLKKLMEQKIL